MITGAPFTAAASALTRTTPYRLDGPALVAAIAAKPELALAMEAMAERVIAAMRRDATAAENAGLARPDVLPDKVRSFLRLLDAGR